MPQNGAMMSEAADSLVFAMADGLKAGKKFAEASSRRLVVADSLSGILEGIDPSLAKAYLISAGSALTSEDLATLTAKAVSLGCSMGFVGGWGGPDSGLRHVEKMLSYRWTAPTGTLLWSSTGFNQVGSASPNALQIIAPDDPTLIERLAVPRRFVGLFSHSNGIDGPLGPSVLCSIVESKAALDGRAFFPCGSGGPCVRGHQIGDKVEPPSRVSPTAIAGDVVLWYSCWGLLTAEAIFDPARSIAQDFLNSRWAGALLTTYRSVMPEGCELLTMLFAVDLLALGMSIGEICLQLNRLCPLDSDADYPWVLLGDPLVRFPAIRSPSALILRAGVPTQVALTPGTVRILDLESDGTFLLTAQVSTERQSNNKTLCLGQLPGTPKVICACIGEKALECSITAYPKESPPAAYRILNSIWHSIPQLAFTQSFVRHLRTNARAAKVKFPAELEEQISERLAAQLKITASSNLLSLLSGSEDSLLIRAGAEGRAWYDLHTRLLDFLVSYCESVGALLSYTYATDCRLAKKVLLKDRCPYCHMRLEASFFDVPLTGLRRKTIWCYRCAMISDTSDDVDRLWLIGPDEVDPGTAVTYTIDLRLVSKIEWGHYQAKITIEYVPWKLDIEHELAEFSLAAEDRAEVPLIIRLPHSVPPGIYFLIGAVAAHGDIWVCRRPLLIRASARGA